MAIDREQLYFETSEQWEAWLAENHEHSPGVVLTLAKKGSPHPSPSQPEALDVALCFGWIDGVRNALDGDFYLQTYMPRVKRSTWSIINQEKVAALINDGRMSPAGHAEIDRAKADGRWDAAYAGPKTIVEPDDFAAALAANPRATAFYPLLTSQNRYAILFRLHHIKSADTRARNIAAFVAQLERGETAYPQKKQAPEA
ncbi:MAG: YdeI/OmpD-associated family protein [Microbacteriaceae bacterium]